MFQTSETIWNGGYAAGKQIALCLPPESLLPWSSFVYQQATLEIEFMHQTLSRYVTPSAAKTLSELYSKISQAYARRPGDENLQGNLDGVKKTLADTRRATGVECLCFRQAKTTAKGSQGTSKSTSASVRK
jgi:exocyst complex component 2